MDSVRLARSNIKIKSVEAVSDGYWVCYEYQWRDNHYNPRWSGDVTFVPNVMAVGDEDPRPTTTEDIRAWVNIDVMEARERLEPSGHGEDEE